MFDKIRRQLSPSFLAMLLISFTLWYITKLSYSYTTNFDLKVVVRGENVVIPCVYEGKGTNLLHYYMSPSEIELDLKDVSYSVKTTSYTYDGQSEKAEPNKVIILKPSSLHSYLSLKFSDIKVVSVGDIPEIPYVKK